MLFLWTSVPARACLPRLNCFLRLNVNPSSADLQWSVSLVTAQGYTLQITNQVRAQS
jgi:hypothetical protein